MSFAPVPALPLLLAGDARARGRAQAHAPDTDGEAVRRAVQMRLDQNAALLRRADIARYLARQAEVLGTLDPDGAAELAGIAEGFGLREDALLAYLHLGVIADMADGCSAFAHAGEGGSPILAKNRDYRGEHARLQRVMLHRDPAQPGLEVLCVGSLGSPGAFSSGMNSAGLALVDTHVGTRDHGPGLLRYFLMTRLLWRATNVPEALAEIARLPQAGGGTIVMADSAGRHAAVELGHERTAIDAAPAPWRVRTNHFRDETTRPAFRPAPADPMASSSTGRLARLEKALAAFAAPPTPGDAARLMAGHAEAGVEALCRHGEDGDALTISTALFAPAELALYFSPQRPCAGQWQLYRIGAGATGDGRAA